MEQLSSKFALFVFLGAVVIAAAVCSPDESTDFFFPDVIAAEGGNECHKKCDVVDPQCNHSNYSITCFVYSGERKETDKDGKVQVIDVDVCYDAPCDEPWNYTERVRREIPQ